MKCYFGLVVQTWNSMIVTVPDFKRTEGETEAVRLCASVYTLIFLKSRCF